MIKAIYLCTMALFFLMLVMNIKADLEIVKTNQYLQTLTLKQILGDCR